MNVKSLNLARFINQIEFELNIKFKLELNIKFFNMKSNESILICPSPYITDWLGQVITTPNYLKS